MKTSWLWLGNGLFCTSLLVLSNVASGDEPIPKGKLPGPAAGRVSGREIFLREWLPNDPRSHGGDGLGPVFNETSCVSCHNQGGVGGGGAEAKNVVVISAARNNPLVFGQVQQHGEQVLESDSPTHPTLDLPLAPQAGTIVALTSIAVQGAHPVRSFGTANLPGKPVPQGSRVPQTVEEKEEQRKRLIEELKSIHPGLVTSRSVVLHKSGTDPTYAEWRDKVLGLDVVFNVTQITFAPAGGMETLEEASAADQTPQQADDNAISLDKQSVDALSELFTSFFDTVVREFQPPKELTREKQRAGMDRFPNGVVPMPDVITVNGQVVERPQRTLSPVSSARNSIALFGVGLIDSIPIDVIEAEASKEYSDFPEISGRIARLKDGRIGRFGWKAQKATLYDFTMTACAVELGLNVPDHPQAGIPNKPDYQPAGFDLDQEECKELVRFLKDLPAPTRSGMGNPLIAKELELGRNAFESVGCAACHVSNMGEVKGIYSDLLVHDMGPELGDSGGYGVFQPQSPGNDADDPLSGLMANEAKSPIVPLGTPVELAPAMFEEKIPEKMIGAGRQEWRTPPLWGIRDSAPYLHDGRAGTLEQAIAMHGGEAQMTANRFFRLPPEEKTRVLAFLRSLVAPDQ